MSAGGPFPGRDEPRADGRRPARTPTFASKPPGGAARGRRSGWVVGALVVIFLVYVAVNSVRSDGPGASGLAAGARLPPFAVPLALSDLEGDANVATAAGQDQAGARPACRVRGPEVLNVCELAERGPVVLGFLATRGGDCADAIGRLERVRARHPGVQVAVVGIRGDRGDLRDLVRRRGWRFPVGHDRDGILANLYGVAVCPQITFARWRGRVQGTALGDLSPQELDRRVRAVVAASRKAGWEPPA